jgi:hypothetical protein
MAMPATDMICKPELMNRPAGTAMQTEPGMDMAPLAAASAQDTLPSRQQVFGERGVATCDVGQFCLATQGLLSQAPAMAWYTLPQLTYKARYRAVNRCLASAVLLRAMWTSFSSRPRALQPKRRQRHGAPRCIKRVKQAASLPTGVWRPRCRFVRRGPDF